METKSGRIKYESGQKINLVTLLREVPSDKDRKAEFLCFCGNHFIAWIHSVKSNVTKSCGCLRREYMRNKQTKHGFSRHPLYNTYNNMMERCYTKTNISYEDYGGRGVKVCNEWKDNCESFYSWALLNGWEEGLQLDKDTKGNGMIYSPETCCFVTPKQNCNKRRTSRFIEYNGISKTMAEWSDLTGIKSHTIFARLKMGWSIEKALKTSISKNGRSRKTI